MNYILPRSNPPISTPSHTFLRQTSLLPTPLRLSGRSPTTPRPIRLSFSRSHNIASCTTQFGNTRSSASVRGELIPPPNVDRPNDGQVKFCVDVGPMGCMGYDVVTPASNYNDGGGEGEASYTQRLESNRLLRILERTLLIGGSIDAEALCVQSGVWVWRLVVEVSLVCNDGNAVDACVLAVVAALRHFRLAQVENYSNDEEGESSGEMVIVDSDEKEPTPLPLHHTPVTATFALFSDEEGNSAKEVSALIDPTEREELAADGLVTWSYNKYGEMCCLDFPGGCELSPTQLMSSSDLGKKRCIEICEMLETALLEAESKAQAERMERLKQNARSLVVVPRDDNDVAMNDNADVDAKEDEEYRKLALDYASGHIAASVKGDKPASLGSNKMSEASSLFHSFLQSVKKNTVSDQTIVSESMKVESDVQEEDKTMQYENDDDVMLQTEQEKCVAIPKVDSKEKSCDNSDEEENIIQLNSEFSSVVNEEPADEPMTESNPTQKPTETAVVSKEPKKAKKAVEDKTDDANDLTAALKKKKSKKSKKKA